MHWSEDFLLNTLRCNSNAKTCTDYLNVAAVNTHINFDELSQMKIPALRGRARQSTLLILETIAAEGPLLKYDVYKRLEKRDSTVFNSDTKNRFS